MSTNLEHNLHVGPAGWRYDDWEGIVYPLPHPRKFDPLAYLASYFNLIEINSTFYHVPPPHICRRWVDRVQQRADFRFTVKAHQSLTHRRGRESELAPFLRALDPLAEAGRLGAVLLQFPWSFRFDAEACTRVSALLDALAAVPVAVEVRHGSWETPDAEAYLAERQVTRCGIDQPVIGESVGPYGYRTGRAGSYFRFHGRNYRDWFAPDAGRDARYDYLYSDSELSPWVDVVRRAAGGGAPTFVVLNNHFRGQAPANAFAMAAMLLGRPVPAPARLRSEYPQLSAWTVPGPGDTDRTPGLFGD